ANVDYGVAPTLMKLYLAKKGDTWLKTDDHDVVQLKEGVISTTIDDIMKNKMDQGKSVGHIDFAFPDDKTLKNGEVHLLLALPVGAAVAGILALPRKRKLSVEKLVKLADLWDLWNVDLEELPDPSELKSILLRQLPLQLALDDDTAAKKICDPNGQLLQCRNLTTMIETYFIDCTTPVKEMASENTWQQFYDDLFRITKQLCLAKGILLNFRRNRVGNTGTTLGTFRPDLILHYDGMVLLRGEEKSSTTVIDASCDELTKKMRKWNPMLYGDLPYILGYATSGSRLKIVVIDRSLHAEKVLEFYSILAQKEDVVKTFYNLSFFLAAMIKLSKRSCESTLMPYTPHATNRRTIELMDDVVKRTINRDQCAGEDDFRRLINVYKTLQALSNRERGRSHLQTVRKLKLTDQNDSSLKVQLAPLGFSRKPENAEEVFEWLLGMVTALKLWHGSNYCHGDIRWRNIVYVPTSNPGYWVLIDMDESHRPQKAEINWSHDCQGDILTFQHDLYQLGILMQSFEFPLNGKLLCIKTTLLSAVMSQLSVEEVLMSMKEIE
ncbi:unnamed protein product, partial [Aphanomyces euteiches]